MTFYRTLGGEAYQLYKLVGKKTEASKIKDKMKRQGYYVRVLKYRGEYAIFIR